jgi:membrane carboxypeptidase/penicillin-binding protein
MRTAGRPSTSSSPSCSTFRSAPTWAKFEQAILGVEIDSGYSKRQILRAYLASVYFGQGYYGLAIAAPGYFGLAPGDLSWAQASLLSRLVATGVFSRPRADAAFAAPLRLRVPQA